MSRTKHREIGALFVSLRKYQPFSPQKLDIQRSSYFFGSSRQNRYQPIIWQYWGIRPPHLLMPVNSSVMPWEIGEYRGMGRFQNNGAAGGLGLRHRDYRCAGFPFLIAGDVYCLSIASAFVGFGGAVFLPSGGAVFSPVFALPSVRASSHGRA